MTHLDEVRLADRAAYVTGFTESACRRSPFRGILAWRPDAVSVLSLIVFSAFMIPARYIIHGMSAVGTPAFLLGVGAF
jgi:hypothetical protein